MGRESEAVAFLSARAERQAGRAQGSEAWLTAIDALEDYGRPDAAMALMERVWAERSGDSEVGCFATPFWVRMGRWDRAEAALAAVEATGHRLRHLEAATQFHETAGRWEKALVAAQAWMQEAPDAPAARRALLRLGAMRDGRSASLALSRRWMEEHPGHEEYENIHLEQLHLFDAYAEARGFLVVRTARNPTDAAAWRDLAHLAFDEAGRLGADAREACLAEAEAAVSRLRALVGVDAAVHALDARLLLARGRRAEATERLLAAVDVQPSYGWAAEQAWEAAAGESPDEQRRIQGRLEAALQRVVGPRHGAGALARMIARRFGVAAAEAAVVAWRAKLPDDPELVAALADLWLEHGQGRTDAARAAELLEAAVARYPAHFGLRGSLAEAYRVLGRDEDALVTLREQVRRRPLAAASRYGLATALAARGDLDGALALLEEGTRLDPLDAEAWSRRARFLWTHGRDDAAIDVLAEGLLHDPRGVGLRGLLVRRLQERARHEEAVRVAREGVEVFPDGAYLWFLLAEALNRGVGRAAVTEVEEAYRRALSWNRGLYEAAEALSTLLANQGRHDEALAVIDGQLAVQQDPAPARGQRAWILRAAGKRREAVEELVRVVEDHPAFGWGWNRLMRWFTEDETWDRARVVLEKMPPAARGDPDLAAQRLTVLRSCGVPDAELDRSWDRLLADFPAHEPVGLRRFDLLRERRLLDRAEAVLGTLERHHPKSPYVAARRVELLAGRGKLSDAAKAALALFQRPDDELAWLDEAAWGALPAGRTSDRTADDVLAIVRDGGHVRLRAFELAVGQVGGKPVRLSPIDRLVRRLDPRRLWGGPERVRRLNGVLAALTRDEREDGRRTSAVLRTLSSVGERGVAMAYVRRHAERCARLTPLWQRIGHLLVDGGRRDRREVRRWLADWRGRPGVEMWSVANYVQGLRRIPGPGGLPEDLEEIERTASDALERLPHDATAHALALVLAEVTLRRGTDFEGVVRRHRVLLEDTSPGRWVPPSLMCHQRAIRLFAELLRVEPGPAAAAREHDVVRWTRELVAVGPKPPTWIRREWLARLRGRMSSWGRVVAWIRLSIRP